MNEKKRDGNLEWLQSGSNLQCEDSANVSRKDQKMTNINTDKQQNNARRNGYDVSTITPGSLI